MQCRGLQKETWKHLGISGPAKTCADTKPLTAICLCCLGTELFAPEWAYKFTRGLSVLEGATYSRAAGGQIATQQHCGESCTMSCLGETKQAETDSLPRESLTPVHRLALLCGRGWWLTYQHYTWPLLEPTCTRRSIPLRKPRLKHPEPISWSCPMGQSNILCTAAQHSKHKQGQCHGQGFCKKCPEDSLNWYFLY
jgi:hypothetical protein